MVCMTVAQETVCYSDSTPRPVVGGWEEGKAPNNKSSDDRKELVFPVDQLADEDGEVPDVKLTDEGEVQLADEDGEVPDDKLADEGGKVPGDKLADEGEELAEEEIHDDRKEESDSDDDLQQLVQTLQSFVEEASTLNGYV